MAKSNFTQSLCFLYLIISGHLLVDCRRVKTVSDDRQQDDQSALESMAQEDANFEELSVEQAQSNSLLEAEENSEFEELAFGEAKVSHPWCNVFSRLKEKRYHFDVELDDKHCEDGACMALELIRHKEHPELHVHAGQSWLVTKDDNDEIVWTARSVSDEQFPDQEIVMRLDEAEVIQFFPANDDFPDKLEIHNCPGWKQPDALDGNSSAHTGHKTHQVFELVGGLFYSEELLAQGWDKLSKFSHEEMQAMEDAAAEDSHGTRGSSIGKKVGFGGAVLSVGGMYTAATVTGVAIQTQALIGASIVGIIGGTLAGALLGGIVGVAIAGALIIGGAKKIKGYKPLAASRKIFEKLRCLDDVFDDCGKNKLVPKGKKCPQER